MALKIKAVEKKIKFTKNENTPIQLAGMIFSSII